MTLSESEITEYGNPLWSLTTMTDGPDLTHRIGYFANYERLPNTSECGNWPYWSVFSNAVDVSGLVTSVLLHCIRRCVESDGEGGCQTIERLLLFLIFHCAKDDDHSKAMKDLGTAFSCTSNGPFVYFLSAVSILTFWTDYGKS